MKKIGNTVLKILVILLYLLTFGYIGFMCGQASDYEGSKGFIVTYIVFLISLYVMYLLHIMIHEAGHLIGGLLTGYEYVSFRIGSFVWVKEAGKLKVKKMKLAGTAGQCLMCPPNIPDEEVPYKLYHISGGLINVILGLVCFGISFVFPETIYMLTTFRMFGLVGLVLGATNLIPCKMGGMQNDGYNLWDLGKNLDAKACMNILLRMNALLTVAESYDELPDEMVNKLLSFDFKNKNLENSVIANTYLYQAAINYAKGNLKEAFDIYKDIFESNSVLQIFKNEAGCEVLFHEILNGADAEIIDKHYSDKNLSKYIKMTLGYPSRQRLLYTYYSLYKKDDVKAEEAFNNLEKLKDNFAVKADAMLEYNVALSVKNGQLGSNLNEEADTYVLRN